MLFFRDFFQNLFGFQNQDDRRNDFDVQNPDNLNEFRNPIWQNGDDDDEFDDDRYLSRRNLMDFRMFSDPFEMSRYFESQMENMMQNFFNFTIDNTDESSIDFTLPPPPPPPPEQSQKSLRDQVLKPGYETPVKFENKNKFHEDLDGKRTADHMVQLWPKPENAETPVSRSSPFQFQSFGKSIVSQVIRREDGTFEERKTVSDSQGNSETTVTRKIGDKVHTVITKRDKNGVEIIENFDNFDESELDKFNNNWNKPKPTEPTISPKQSNDNDLWSKFFGINTKL